MTAFTRVWNGEPPLELAFAPVAIRAATPLESPPEPRFALELLPEREGAAPPAALDPAGAVAPASAAAACPSAPWLENARCAEGGSGPDPPEPPEWMVPVGRPPPPVGMFSMY